jgi:peptide chain release factor subunit 1
MLRGSDLKELLNYAAQNPVLSVYLNTDPTQGSADRYRLRLRNMLKDVALQDDVEVVERYLEHEYDWSGRSLAVFSCVQEDFFRAFSFGVPVRSRVRVGSRPYVKPLADLFDSFGEYGVALVDQQGARLFHFHLGELQEQEGLVGAEVRRTKSGGGSQTSGQRGGVQAAGRRGGEAGLTKHADGVAERNMRESAEFAARFFSQNDIRRILIGGTENNVALFLSQLPKSWQSLVMGTFPMSMTVSHAEVQSRAMEIAREAERKREARLVDQLITAAAKGQAGVVSLDDTLRAVHEGRVQTLAYIEGFREPGLRCTGCGFLTTQEPKSCPFCGSSFDQISDAVESAVRKVMQEGGEVEVIRDSEALVEAGKIGGLLRY